MQDKAAPKIGDVYRPRITCFVDILGFSRDVLQIKQRPGLFLSIDAVLRHIWMCKRDLDSARQTRGVKHDARMTQFSDCLVTSYLPEEGAVLRALSDAAFLGHVILRAGYLPRGAITLGPLFHDDVVVYGEALIEAVDLEKSIVDSPRVLLTPGIMQLFRRETEGLSEIERDYVREECGGPFVHILGNQWPFLKKERLKEEAGELQGNAIHSLFEEMKSALPLRYQNAPHDRARRKIEWMRDYVNGALGEHRLGSEFEVVLPPLSVWARLTRKFASWRFWR